MMLWFKLFALINVRIMYSFVLQILLLSISSLMVNVYKYLELCCISHLVSIDKLLLVCTVSVFWWGLHYSPMFAYSVVGPPLAFGGLGNAVAKGAIRNRFPTVFANVGPKPSVQFLVP